MLLSTLISDSACNLSPHSNKETDIVGMSCDSRQIQSNWLFVALKGVKVDGTQFIAQAIAQGAAAILTEKEAKVEIPENIAHITSPNARQAYARLASNFYQEQPQHCVAVTGTNGKTSVAHFCQQIWAELGEKSASLGTLGLMTNEKDIVTEEGSVLTTPEPVKLHRILQKLKHKACNYMALEASSHGLSQYRLDGVTLEAAAFTNISRDHLDYHVTMEAYIEAKLRLFKEVLPPQRTAVLNADSEHYLQIEEACKAQGHNIITYGEKAEDIRLISIIPTVEGQLITFMLEQVQYRVQVPLIGKFQVYNMLCALGLVIATGGNKDRAIAKLTNLRAVPGRMEQVGHHPKKASVFVDYAHTPDALKEALISLRPHTHGKLYLIMGCGGERDTGKRTLMGRVAAEHADEIIVTDDNPRNEDPVTIRKAIISACPGAIEIGDRREAIESTIHKINTGDILLIAGKGHETTQTVGSQTIEFDDRMVACEAITTCKG